MGFVSSRIAATPYFLLSNVTGIKIVWFKGLKPSLISEHSKKDPVFAWALGLLCGSRQWVRHDRRLLGSRPGIWRPTWEELSR